MMLRRILFPVDFSKTTESMVPYVTEMTHRFHATVTILNVFNLAPDYLVEYRPDDTCESQPCAIPYVPVLQQLRKQRERRLKEFARMQFGGVTRITRVEDGDPAAVIKRVVQFENIDLIVMPTKGLGRFRRFLLGSVTAKVLHDVSCAVLTSAHEPEPALATASGYRSIICAVDLNPEADAVLKAAGFLAEAPSSHEHDEQASAEGMMRDFERSSNVGGAVRGNTIVRVLHAPIVEGIRRTVIEQMADPVVLWRGTSRRIRFALVATSIRDHSRVAMPSSQYLIDRSGRQRSIKRIRSVRRAPKEAS